MVSKETAERTLSADRSFMEHLACMIVPCWALVMCAIMRHFKDQIFKNCDAEEAVQEGTFDIMVMSVCIFIVKIVLLREGGRVALLTKYLEKLVIMQLLNSSMSVATSFLKEESSSAARLPCMFSDALAFFWGLYICKNYFGWTNITYYCAHADIAVLCVLLIIASFIANHSQIQRVSPGEAFSYCAETACDWMEVWFFMGGAWAILAQPRSLTEPNKMDRLANDKFRKQAFSAWTWFMLYFFVDDIIRPYWEGEYSICMARPLMIAHQLHLLVCLDFAIFYLYQVYMPQNYQDEGEYEI